MRIPTIPLRPAIGLGAAFVTMALVAIAAMTAPDAKTTLHASTVCGDTTVLPEPSGAAEGVERPA